MTRHYIKARNIRLSYLQVNPEKDKLIFFLHGNSGSANLWQSQLEHKEFQQYRLIAFDLPGHGISEASENASATYNVLAMGATLAAAVKELSGNRPYILMGLSLGTNIIAEMLVHDIMPSGIILASSTIVGSGILPENVVMAGASSTVLYEDRPAADSISLFTEETHHSGLPWAKEKILSDYFAVKPGFRSALKNSIPAKLYSDEVLLLQKYHRPILCIHGLADRITSHAVLDGVALNYWRDGVIKIPEAGHLLMYDVPQQLNRLVSDYIQEMFSEGPVQERT